MYVIVEIDETRALIRYAGNAFFKCPENIPDGKGRICIQKMYVIVETDETRASMRYANNVFEYPENIPDGKGRIRVKKFIST